jgi:hypothetical protein
MTVDTFHAIDLMTGDKRPVGDVVRLYVGNLYLEVVPTPGRLGLHIRVAGSKRLVVKPRMANLVNVETEDP